MMPKHCKEVGIKEVDYHLTEKEIKNHLMGRKIYTLTRYLILNRGKEWAVVELKKRDIRALFREVVGVEVISLPKETVFVEEPKVDVLNPTSMTELAMEHPGKTVIIKGMYEHISFVNNPKFKELMVVDVAPPTPSKLSTLLSEALSLNMINIPVNIQTKVIDLNQLANDVSSKAVMFPCYCSGLKFGTRTLYLDKHPKLKKGDIDEVTLIGCELSKRIFKELYGETPKFLNICPKEHLDRSIKDQIILTRCCKVKEGYKIEGNTAIVPWGATHIEVIEAIEKLLIKIDR